MVFLLALNRMIIAIPIIPNKAAKAIAILTSTFTIRNNRAAKMTKNKNMNFN